MPVVIPIVAAVAVTVVSATVTSIVLQIVLVIAISVASALAQRAFQKKPKRNPLSFDDRAISIRQPIGPAEIWLGEGKKGGTIVFIERTGADVWIIIVWAFHQVKAITDAFFNEEQVPVNIDGSVDGTYAGKVEIYHHLGTEDQVADAKVKTAFPRKWTAAHRLAGLAYSAFRFVNTATNYQSGIPALSVYGRGHANIYNPKTGLYGYSDNPILCTRDQLTSSLYGFGVSDIDVDDVVSVVEAAYCDEFVPVGPDTEYFYFQEGFNAASTDITLNQVNIGAHTLYTGDRIRIALTGGTSVAPVPLNATTTYFAIRVGTNSVAFATTLANAESDTRIDLTTTGTQPVVVYRVDAPIRLAGTDFTATGANTTQETLTGAGVYTYCPSGTRGRFEFTSTPIGGLADNTQYFLVQSAAGMFVSPSPDDDEGINLTSAGAANRFWRTDGSGGSFGSIDADSMITLWEQTGYGEDWPTGTELIVRANGGTLPAGLVDGQRVYWIKRKLGISDFDRMGRLAVSRRDAMLGRHMKLGTTFSTTAPNRPYLETDYHGSKIAKGLQTGDQVTLDSYFGTGPYQGSGGGNGSTKVYWIRLSPTTGYVAATLEDAWNGNAIEATDLWSNSTDGAGDIPAIRVRMILTRHAQRRFVCQGVYDTGSDLDEVQQALMTSCAGTVLEPIFAGKWRLKAGRYRVPLRALDATMVRAGATLTVQSRPALRDAVNTIRAIYVSPENDDQPASAPEYRDERFIEEDNGVILVKDISLPFTPSTDQALRIMGIELMRGRYGRTISWPGYYGHLPGVEVTDTVDVNLPDLNYVNREFELTGRRLSFDPGGTGVPLPLDDYILRETGPEVYAI